jgi:hypothetical protein
MDGGPAGPEMPGGPGQRDVDRPGAGSIGLRTVLRVVKGDLAARTLVTRA